MCTITKSQNIKNMHQTSKSDWKHFQSSLSPWRERFITRLNQDIRNILDDNNLTETEKFWNIVEFQKEKAKVLRDCLDGYSKSRMGTHLLMMLNYEMITDVDLEGFSEGLREWIKWVRQ